MPALRPSNAPPGQSQADQILDALEACGLPFTVAQESNGTWWANGHHGRTLRDALAQLTQVRLLRGLDKRTRNGSVVLPDEMTETLQRARLLQQQQTASAEAALSLDRKYDFVIDESALQALEQVRQ